MTTAHHTPLPFGGPLTSAAMEAPLGQLDAAIATVISTGSGASTTLTAQATAGTSGPFTVASTTGFLAGDPIYFGTGSTFESRTILAIVNGTQFTTTANLTNTYAIGAPVSKSPVEIVDARAGAISLGARLATMVPASGPNKIEINGGFTNPYDTDLWVSAANNANPVLSTQALWAVHRISGNVGAVVHDAAAVELRVSGISNSTFLNALEATANVVGGGGAHAIANLRALTANLRVESAPTGTVTTATIIQAQAVPAITPLVITTLYGLYIEPQTVGVTNWSIYAPTGASRLGVVSTDGDLTVGVGTGARNLIVDGAAGQNRDLRFNSGGSLRWILRATSTAEGGANAGSDLSLLARDDTGGAVATVFTITRSTGAFGFSNVPIGFFGAAPSAKAAITGSRGGNAALASLLTQLATKGLITDSTTA